LRLEQGEKDTRGEASLKGMTFLEGRRMAEGLRAPSCFSFRLSESGEEMIHKKHREKAEDAGKGAKSGSIGKTFRLAIQGDEFWGIRGKKGEKGGRQCYPGTWSLADSSSMCTLGARVGKEILRGGNHRTRKWAEEGEIRKKKGKEVGKRSRRPPPVERQANK